MKYNEEDTAINTYLGICKNCKQLEAVGGVSDLCTKCKQIEKVKK